MCVCVCVCVCVCMSECVCVLTECVGDFRFDAGHSHMTDAVLVFGLHHDLNVPVCVCVCDRVCVSVGERERVCVCE